MAAGEIAGFTLGAVSDQTWAQLFAVRIDSFHPSSAQEMTTLLRDELSRDELSRGGLVLAAHDGFYDSLAADKYGRRHVMHNSLLYGMSPDGAGYLVADRGYRVTVPAEQVWRWSRAELSSLLVMRAAGPFVGDWPELVRAGTSAMRSALADDLDADDIARIGVTVDADLADVRSAERRRWQQTHAFFAGVARSRALFLLGLDGAATAGHVAPPSPALRASFGVAVDGWQLVARSLYKCVQRGARVPAQLLAQRVAAAQEADRAALAALALEDPAP